MTAVFPQAPVDLKAELDLTVAGWTDITSSVYQRDDSTPVTVTRGRPDESSQATPAAAKFQLNNRSGNFTVRNPAGAYYGQLNRNTPIRFSVPAAGNYLRLEGDDASTVSAPDAAGLHITGDLDVRLDIKLTDYRSRDLAFRWVSGSNQSWLVNTNGDGTVTLFWSTTGSDFPFAQSTVPLPVGRLAVRVTLAVSTGTVTFYTGPAGGADGSTWTQLGDAVVAGATSIHAGTAPFTIGTFTGNCYEAELRAGIAGTVKAHPVFTAQTAGATSFTDAQSNTWTLNGTAEISGRDYRFHGEMSALPVTWDSSGNDVWTPAAAGGQLRRLGQGNAPVYSAMKRAVLALSGTLAPVAYWPCEDLSGATSIGSAMGGPLMSVSGSADFAADTSFACSAGLPVINSSAWYGTIPGYTSNGSIVVRFLMDVQSGPGNATRIMRVITTGTCFEFSLYYTTGGGLGLAGFASDGSTVFDTGAVSFSIDGSPRWVSMELQPSGGTVDYSIVTLIPGASTGQASSGSFSGTIGNATACYVNPRNAASSIGLGHITVQSDWQSLFDLFHPLFAWQGETAANRVARLCSENGYSARIVGAPDVSVAMGPQSPDTLSNLLQECETADAGQLFEPRQALALGYRTLASICNQDPAVTLDYSAAELGGTGTELAPTYDDQYSRNDITAQRSSGATSGASYRSVLDDGSAMSISAPPAGIGDYSDSVNVNVEADAQLPDAAGWLVHLGTVDDFRWPEVPVNMARAAVTGVSAAVQGCDIGDRADIINPPSQLPPDDIRQVIAQTTEVLGGYHWTISLAGVPESPYETVLLDDAVYGAADTDGSTLHANITSGATSMQVDTTAAGSPLWTTTAGDFPFDVNLDGEQITVTNITGSSSPQTFTITRSVNGVVKAHAAGADVRLQPAPVLALQ